MRTNAAILWNVLGQSLSLHVPQGRPTAATFDVFRNWATDDSTPEFSGTATIDSVETTVAAPAGPAQADPQKVSLASTTGIEPGRQYLLSENGVSELVEPIEIRAGYVRGRFPLQNNFTTAAAFVSTTISAAIDATFVADRSKLSDLADPSPDYRVRWAITVGGATIIAHSVFDVVRAETRHSVDIADVNDRAPGLVDSLPTEYRSEAGRPLLDAAWRAVRAEFVAISIDPNALRSGEVVDELVILRALRLLAEGGWHPPRVDWSDYLKLTTDNYNTFFQQHFAVTLKHQLHQERVLAQAGDARPSSSYWGK